MIQRMATKEQITAYRDGQESKRDRLDRTPLPPAPANFSIPELSLTVPITNSLAFLFTVLGEWLAEGKVISRGECFSWLLCSVCFAGASAFYQSHRPLSATTSSPHSYCSFLSLQPHNHVAPHPSPRLSLSKSSSPSPVRVLPPTSPPSETLLTRLHQTPGLVWHLCSLELRCACNRRTSRRWLIRAT